MESNNSNATAKAIKECVMGKVSKILFGLGIATLLAGCGGDVSNGYKYKKIFSSFSQYNKDTKEKEYEYNATMTYNEDTGNTLNIKATEYWDKSITDNNKTYSYDENNTLIKVNREFSDIDYKTEVRYQHDSLGNLVGVKEYTIYLNGYENLSAKIVFEYNDDHNMTSYKEWYRSENNILEETPAIVESYTYNEMKQLSTYKSKYYYSMNDTEHFEVGKRKYVYDDNNRLVTMVIEDYTQTGEEHFSYTDKGKIDKITGIGKYRGRSRNYEYNYSYDGKEKLIKKVVKSDGEITKEVSYTYDKNGNIEKIEAETPTKKFITTTKWKLVKEGNQILNIPKVNPYRSSIVPHSIDLF